MKLAAMLMAILLSSSAVASSSLMGETTGQGRAYRLSGTIVSTPDAEEEERTLTVLDVSDTQCTPYRSTEQTRESEASFKWEFAKHSSIKLSVPADLSGYKTLSWWIYVPEGYEGATFIMMFVSDDAATDGADYYGAIQTVKNAGWNHLQIPINMLGANRSPKGWDQIDRLQIACAGWNQTNDMNTVLYMEDICLSTSDGSSTSSLRIPAIAEAAAFCVGGTRAVIHQHTIQINEEETARVFREGDTYYLPLSVFGAYYDPNAKYTPKTSTLTMRIDDTDYTFVGNRAVALVNGVQTALPCLVRVKDNALFVPHTYIMELFGYTEMYTDEMGLVILSREPIPLNTTDNLDALLSVAYASLFQRPGGTRAIEDMYMNLAGPAHPRILLRQSEIDRLCQLYKTDETLKGYVDTLTKTYGIGTAEYNDAVVSYTNLTRNSLSYTIREAKDRIIPWCFLYHLTGDSRYAERTWKELEALIGFPTWNVELLDVGQACFTVSLAYDWLYDVLTPAQRSAIEKAVLEKGIRVGLDCHEGRSNIWGDTNWNGVCNGGLGTAAIAFADVYTDECTALLGYTLRDVERGMYTYAPDGGYVESVGYWEYGTEYLHAFFGSLQSACGTTYGLYNSPGFAESAYFTTYLSTDTGIWNFHDAGNGAVQANTNTLAWFARMSDDSVLRYLRRSAIEKGLNDVHIYDVIWYEPKAVSEGADSLSLSRYYKRVGTVTMRNTWEDGVIFTGLHGGRNDASHGDLDIGNFVLEASGKQFIADLGKDSYAIEGYGSSTTKFRFYRKRAEGQNTLVIGDVSYEVPDQERHGVGEFLRVEDGPSSSLAVVDMSGAYASVTSGARGLLFADDRSTVIVQDEITLTSPEIVRWGVHTEGNIVIGTGGRYAFIQCGTKILYCEIVSEDADLKFSWGPAKSYDPKYTMSKNEMSCDSYRRLMIVTEKPVDTFNVAVIFRVIGSRNEKPALGTAYTWTPMENWSVS